MIPRHKIDSLTSLRFLAAFIIVLYHTAPMALRVNGIFPVGNFINISFISVGFFFTLSGYILGTVYLQREAPLDKKRFWIARFARIYPLFAVSLVLDLPNLLLFRAAKYGWKIAVMKTIPTFAGNALMLQAWILKLRALNNPVWSLSVETVFYLLFPYLGWRLWKASAKGAVWGSALFYVAGMAAIFAAIQLRISPDVVKFNPLFHLPEFFIGILVAKWHVSKSASPAVRTKLKSLAPWIALSALAMFVAAIYAFPLISELYFRDGLLLPAYVLAIVAFGSGSHLLDRFFAMRWLVVLGEASYGLYLIHQVVWSYVMRTSFSEKLWFYPVYLAGTVGLSVVGFYFFENPSREAVLHWAHTRSKETVIESSIAQ